ncbi:YceI family protein [Ahrensia marina]|uniref:YceI family protein n=1 Tax=Ahrensia marina TaxID=1514904 RepID=UPI0035D0B1C6
MTLTKVIAGLALSTALIGSAAAEDLSIGSGTYQLDPTHGSLFWSVNHFGLSQYTARINTFEATIELDADDISQSTLTATIDMASVDTDFPNPDAHDFNAELRGENWLNTDAFPQATFVSTGITKTGDTTAEIEGDLTFLGVTLPVTLDTTLIGSMGKHPFADGAAFGIQAVGTIDRTEFGFSTFAPNVGAEVTIEINAEFIGDASTANPS